MRRHQRCEANAVSGVPHRREASGAGEGSVGEAMRAQYGPPRLLKGPPNLLQYTEVDLGENGEATTPLRPALQEGLGFAGVVPLWRNEKMPRTARVGAGQTRTSRGYRLCRQSSCQSSPTFHPQIQERVPMSAWWRALPGNSSSRRGTPIGQWESMSHLAAPIPSPNTHAMSRGVSQALTALCSDCSSRVGLRESEIIVQSPQEFKEQVSLG